MIQLHASGSVNLVGKSVTWFSNNASCWPVKSAILELSMQYKKKYDADGRTLSFVITHLKAFVRSSQYYDSTG